MSTDPNVETDGDPELPLKKHGLSGREELDRGLQATANGEARRHYELGYRYTFTTRQELRHYPLAETELRKAIELDPKLAEAYRALAYAVMSRGMQVDQAIPLYQKAVELKPEYGEAHYALAFILAQSDPRKGREHFKKAMSLGIPDERKLRDRFYQDVN